MPRNYEATYAATSPWSRFTHIEGWENDEPGDVNGDGIINISDVTNLIDALLSDATPAGGDVNHDGQVSIADVTDLIDMLLNGN